MTELTAIIYRAPKRQPRPPVDWNTILMVAGAVLAAIGWAAAAGFSQ